MAEEEAGIELYMVSCL